MTALLLLATLAFAEDPVPTDSGPQTQTTSAFSAGAALEYDLVGDNFGLRLEGLWHPGSRGRNSLRAAVGVLPGPEYLFVPFSLGWRLRTGPDAPHLHALFGAGAEAQLFVISDHAPVARPMFYGELGAAWSLGPHLDVGALVVPELTLINVPGIGLGFRGCVWWR